MEVSSERVEFIVRRELSVRIDQEIRAFLDNLALKYGIVSAEGVPKDAELVRIIVVSVLSRLFLPNIDSATSAATALYVNSVLSMSADSSSLLALFRQELASLAADLLQASDIVVIEDQKAVRGRKDVLPQDRFRVHLKIDDLIRKMLVRVIRADTSGAFGSRCPDSKVVQWALRKAMYDTWCEEVLAIYASSITKVREVLNATLKVSYTAAVETVRNKSTLSKVN